MLTRAIQFINRLSIVQSFRESRIIAGASTGFMFGLGGILKVPLKDYLGGYGPFATVITIGILDFIRRMYNNFKSSVPDQAAEELKREFKVLTTRKITAKLQSNHAKAQQYLHYFELSDNEIIQLTRWNNDEAADVQSILDKLYKQVNFEWEKYPVCATVAMLEMFIFVSEIMLLQVYANPDLFSYSNGMTAANTVLSALLLLGICHSFATFFELKNSYDHPASERMVNVLFKSFDEFEVENVIKRDIASSEVTLDRFSV